jgi:hypothetical protein
VTTVIARPVVSCSSTGRSVTTRLAPGPSDVGELLVEAHDDHDGTGADRVGVPDELPGLQRARIGGRVPRGLVAPERNRARGRGAERQDEERRQPLQRTVTSTRRLRLRPFGVTLGAAGESVP